MKKFTLLFLALFILASAFAQIKKDSTYGFTVTQNKQYGTAINFKGCVQDLYCDIYKPLNNDTARPIIVLIHGGGFIDGAKDAPEIVALATRMASRGYVVASIQYRMGMHLRAGSPTTTCAFGAITMSPCAYALDSIEFYRAEYRAMQDAKGAIRYMKNRNGLDSSCADNTFVMGHSAGAITSLLAAFLDKNSEKLPFTDSISPAPATTNPCTDNNPCNSTSLDRPALGNIHGTIELAGHDESIKGVFAFAGALPNVELLDNNNDSLLVYTFHQDCDPIVYYKKRALLQDVNSCMVCGGCSGLTLTSEHYGNQSLADSISANYPNYKLQTDFIYRNNPINCYYGFAFPDGATCPNLADCPNCANNNYHTCHDIINVNARMDTLATFLFNNIKPCGNTTVGINNYELSDKINCYPNPAKSELNISSLSASLSFSRIEILNYIGERIARFDTRTVMAKTIDISQLASGLYFVKIQTKQGLVLKKFLKE